MEGAAAAEAEGEDEEEAEGAPSAAAASEPSPPQPRTAPSLATALRVLAADPPAVTAGDWGSRAARRSALSSTETRLGVRGEREREKKKSEFFFLRLVSSSKGASGGSLASLLPASISTRHRDTAFVNPLILSASDSATRRRCDSTWAKSRGEQGRTDAN